MSSQVMRVTTCDRCGTTATTEHRCNPAIGDWPTRDRPVNWSQLNGTYPGFDLCPACYQQLKAFMEPPEAAHR